MFFVVKTTVHKGVKNVAVEEQMNRPEQAR